MAAYSTLAFELQVFFATVGRIFPDLPFATYTEALVHTARRGR